MIILWVIPLIVISVSAMLLLTLRGKPVGLRANAYQTSILGVAASSLIALAQPELPCGEMVVMSWFVSVIIGLSVEHELKKCLT